MKSVLSYSHLKDKNIKTQEGCVPHVTHLVIVSGTVGTGSRSDGVKLESRKSNNREKRKTKEGETQCGYEQGASNHRVLFTPLT